MTEPLRDRLRAALPVALKARDRATASTLRSTLAAIENAEAVDAGSVRAGAVEASVRAEIAERERAAEVYEVSGRSDKAAELRSAAEALAAFLE
jgi:uncharacterized protein YqeY